MKRWIGLGMAFAMVLQMVAADFVPFVPVNFTGLPADGDSVTINGVARTFKTSVSAPATQVLIGATTNATAANYAAQLLAYPYSANISAHQNGAIVTLVGTVNQAITTSVSGSWGTATLTNWVITGGTMILPLSKLPASLRAQFGNYLVDAISTYPTNKIPANATSMENFVNISEDQTIRGANIYSNINQIISGGKVDNAALTNINRLDVTNVFSKGTIYVLGDILVTNNQANAIKFYDTSGGINKKAAGIESGRDGFTFVYYNDDGTPSTTVFSTGRSSNMVTAAYIGEPLQVALIYDTWMTNVFITNAIGGFTALWANAVAIAGNLGITNTAPTVTLFDSGGTADDKLTKIVATGDRLAIKFYKDDGTLISTPLDITRVNAAAQTMTVSATLAANNGITVSGGFGVGVDGNTYSGGFFVAGSVDDVGWTPPTGFTSGIAVAYGTAPSADPAAGAIVFDVGGELFARGSVSGEGGGENWRVYHKTSSTSCSGTDYPATTSTAQVDFGGTDPTITLSTAGTWWVDCDTAVQNGGTANDEYRIKLRNTTTSADVSGDVRCSNFGANTDIQPLRVGAEVTTTSANNVIGLWGYNATPAARGTFLSTQTRLRAVRIR